MSAKSGIHLIKKLNKSSPSYEEMCAHGTPKWSPTLRISPFVINFSKTELHISTPFWIILNFSGCSPGMNFLAKENPYVYRAMRSVIAFGLRPAITAPFSTARDGSTGTITLTPGTLLCMTFWMYFDSEKPPTMSKTLRDKRRELGS